MSSQREGLAMRRVTGIMVVLAAAFFISGSLQGQEKVKGVLPANWGKLGLSDEQKQKIYKVQGEYKDKIADLKKQLADLQAKENEELYKILTDDQKKRLKDLLTGKVPAEKEKEKEKDKDK
jgi:hypothetical protein